jgi:hypothetical protein
LESGLSSAGFESAGDCGFSNLSQLSAVLLIKCCFEKGSLRALCFIHDTLADSGLITGFVSLSTAGHFVLRP